MRKILIISFAIITGIVPVFGQNKTSLLQRINDIKTQNDVYFWNQYAAYDADTAKANATNWLLQEINSNREKGDEFSTEEILPYVKHIAIDRGKSVQYFVYAKKAEIASLRRGHSANVSVATETVENPVVNQPEDNMVATVSTQPAQRPFVPDAFVQRIVQTKNFFRVYDLLKSLQAQGQILQFGKLIDVEDYSSFDLILFDMQSQEVITLLSAETTPGYRTNLVNGSEDSLSNYPTKMAAAIWYIKK